METVHPGQRGVVPQKRPERPCDCMAQHPQSARLPRTSDVAGDGGTGDLVSLNFS